jgi:hypothetical protein
VGRHILPITLSFLDTEDEEWISSPHLVSPFSFQISAQIFKLQVFFLSEKEVFFFHFNFEKKHRQLD